MPRSSIVVTHLSPEEIGRREPVVRRIAGLLRPHRGKIALVAVAVVVSAVLTSVLPFLTRAVFDDALFPVDGAEPDLALLGWLVGAMCAIPVVTAAIAIGQNWLTSTVGNSTMADLRSSLFAHLQTMELAFFTSTRTGAIQSRLANDVAGVRTVLTDTATSILSNSVTVISALIAMLLLSWQLTVISVVLIPAFVAVQIQLGKRRQVLARRTQESLSEMTAITEEALSVSGILLSKAFGRGGTEIERYRQANRQQTRLQVAQAMSGRTYFAVVGTFFAITPAVVYLVAGLMIDGGNDALTAGTLVAFTTVQARLQMPLLQLMRVGLDVQTSLALFRRIFEYLDLEPAITERPEAIALDPRRVRGEVEFRQVSFRYPSARQLSGESSRLGREQVAEVATTGGAAADAWALEKIDLRIGSGQLAAVVGPSGSGKTTLTYLVPRFHDVTEGAVLIDGHDVRDLTLDSLAATIGVVTQEPYLFHGTIAENIAYAKPGATAEEIVRAARDANIHDTISSFPEGYRTITGERGYRLSGGEKQRLAIARVLLKNPPILILDEATSALDSQTERLVQEALERATSGRTTIAIAHRLSTIHGADVIFGLQDGQLVESGTHHDLMAAGGLYARLYVEQFTRPGAPGTEPPEAGPRCDVAF